MDSPGGPVVKTSPSNAGSVGSIPDRGVKIPHALRLNYQNINQKPYHNKLNKDRKNGPHEKKIFKKIKINKRLIAKMKDECVSRKDDNENSGTACRKMCCNFSHLK